MSSMAYPLGANPADDPYKKTWAPGSDVSAPGLPAAPAIPAAPINNPPPVAPATQLQKPALALNPQLPQMASGINPDSQYSAEQAQLAAEISQRYNDVLKQLGYSDPGTGNFVMGRVESEANRQRTELARSQGLAAEEQTRQRQAEGTLFSGRRGTEQARAEHPFVQSLADLDVTVPQQLTDLYEQAGNTVSDYTLRNNLLLSDLARRRAAEAAANAQAPGPAGPQPPPPPVVPPGGTQGGPVAPDYTDPILWGQGGTRDQWQAV